MNGQIDIFRDQAAVATAAAEKVLAVVRRAPRDAPRHLVLAGGRTPQQAYDRLAAESRRRGISWAHVHLYWGDERTVPPEHVDSNYRMARENLINHIDIPETNIHRMRGECDPAQAAAEYEATLRKIWGDAPPQFDLLLLGLGEDGHTASLFPGTAAVAEQERWVVAVFVPRLQTWRITLTLPVINNAREVVFVVSGSQKAAILRRLAQLEHPSMDVPASLVRPKSGRLTWLVDAAATPGGLAAISR